MARKRGRVVGGDDRRSGAAFECLGDEIVAVEALAPDGDEQIASLERARIGRDSIEAYVRAEKGAGDRAGCRRVFHHCTLHTASARAAWSASRKGLCTPAQPWYA